MNFTNLTSILDELITLPSSSVGVFMETSTEVMWDNVTSSAKGNVTDLLEASTASAHEEEYNVYEYVSYVLI